MDGLQVAWFTMLVAAGWLIPVGTIRMLAYRSEQVDHTPGMRFVAILALGGGILAALGLGVLSIWLGVRD